jgi:acetoin utilization deacetylase AcuC-like enzyme
MDPIVFFYPEGHEKHASPGHPERPERVEAVRSALQAMGWWEPAPKLAPLPLPEEVVQRIHSTDYLEPLAEACRRGEYLDIDTYVTPSSWELAWRAAGGAAAVADAVWTRRARRGFALTRPPGHHATRNNAMGFCLLNHIALAAEYLIQQHGARRLAIVDLDLHHGNGTQDIFWERSDVFYLSTHQSPLYPGTGGLDETGAGSGAGATANFPLPPGSGDCAFTNILQDLILPLLDRFTPEMLLVSAGFDPHWRDPLGYLLLSAACYERLVQELAAWADERCGGRIALFLEGGYDLEAMSACGQAVTAAVTGFPWQDPLGPSPRPEGKSWQTAARLSRKIWGL